MAQEFGAVQIVTHTLPIMRKSSRRFVGNIVCSQKRHFKEELEKHIYLGTCNYLPFLIVSVNVVLGKVEERTLITGVHIVADLYCSNCFALAGWKYVRCISFILPK